MDTAPQCHRGIDNSAVLWLLPLVLGRVPLLRHGHPGYVSRLMLNHRLSGDLFMRLLRPSNNILFKEAAGKDRSALRRRRVDFSQFRINEAEMCCPGRSTRSLPSCQCSLS